MFNESASGSSSLRLLRTTFRPGGEPRKVEWKKDEVAKGKINGKSFSIIMSSHFESYTHSIFNLSIQSRGCCASMGLKFKHRTFVFTGCHRWGWFIEPSSIQYPICDYHDHRKGFFDLHFFWVKVFSFVDGNANYSMSIEGTLFCSILSSFSLSPRRKPIHRENEWLNQKTVRITSARWFECWM